MVLELAEGVVDDIISALSADPGGMADKLDEIDAEKADFVLPDIKAYYRAERRAIPEFPAILVRCDRSVMVAEHPSIVTMAHELTIGVLHLDTDEDRLVLALERYQRAIFEVIKAAEAAGAIPDMVLFQEFHEGAIWAPSSSEFLSDVRITLTVRRRETWGV